MDRRSAGRVLVIDDEPAICRAVSLALTRAGYDVVPADSGETALGLLRRETVDAVVVDLRMPDMRGDVFFEMAAALQPQLRQRTLFTTGDISERAEELIAACKAPMLRKPFDLAEIVRIVRGFFPQRREETA